MKNEKDQQADICCREEVPCVQCDHCRDYEDKNDTITKTLCGGCQNKLERYDRLLQVMKDIYSETNTVNVVHKTAKSALNYCGVQI